MLAIKNTLLGPSRTVQLQRGCFVSGSVRLGKEKCVHTVSLSGGWRENEVLWLHVPVPLGWHYYPIGHPEFHNEVDLTDLDQYFSVAQGQVLIPRDLYHPVALYRWGTNSPFHCKPPMLTINLTISWWEIVAGTYEPCKAHGAERQSRRLWTRDTRFFTPMNSGTCPIRKCISLKITLKRVKK